MKDKVKEISKWMSVITRTFKRNGKDKTWYFVTRKPKNPNKVDAVAIVGFIIQNGVSGIVLNQSYRPPLNKIVFELPAGLIDEGETAEQAAARELKEETNLNIDVIHSTTPVLYSSPGLTDESYQIVYCECNAKDGVALNDKDEDSTPSIYTMDEIEGLLKNPAVSFCGKTYHVIKELSAYYKLHVRQGN